MQRSKGGELVERSRRRTRDTCIEHEHVFEDEDGYAVGKRAARRSHVSHCRYMSPTNIYSQNQAIRLSMLLRPPTP